MSNSSATVADYDGRYRLAGPVGKYDTRVTPIRGDLADIALAGRLFAPHYVVPMPHVCGTAAVMLRARPQADAVAVSQLLPGEDFAVLDIAGDWAWGYTAHDQYLGYVPLASIAPGALAASHIVSGRSALVFAGADIKSPIIATLPMGAKVAVTGEDGRFYVTSDGFIPIRHLSVIGEIYGDPVDLAQRILGAPYVWGGRGGDGLDCSGLVQMVLGLIGIAAPRDTDQQMAALGRRLTDRDEPERGDIIFFPGHVGLMVDSHRMIHANAHWMQLVIEPLADVLARFPDDMSQPILAAKRL